MIDLQGVSYVRLGTRDIEGATRFATEVLGLEIGERGKGTVYFKSDQREHTLCYVEGDPRDQEVAFEVGSRAALLAAASELEQLGHAVHTVQRPHR
jgi:2,3-dihydroxy-p-cumate/2,3-dihydroxybenzoate 3,4-dioxygenase